MAVWLLVIFDMHSEDLRMPKLSVSNENAMMLFPFTVFKSLHELTGDLQRKSAESSWGFTHFRVPTDRNGGGYVIDFTIGQSFGE